MSFLNFWKKLVSNKQSKKRQNKKIIHTNSLKGLKKKTKKAARKKIIKRSKKTSRKMPKLSRKHKRSKPHKKRGYKIKIRKSKKRQLQANKKLPKKPKEKEIGIITHYYDKISVGIIKLKADLKLRETIRIKSANSDFMQTVNSMQLNHQDIVKAKKGDEIGIKVIKPVSENNRVYRIID
ncbi:MAG: hypothetical protein KBB01_04140 [Candidatus Omnitrophica bacterium]|jgi:putative protease|nr:hypothetical protein [Candidatus Omnitrophota bacterium]